MFQLTAPHPVPAFSRIRPLAVVKWGGVLASAFVLAAFLTGAVFEVAPAFGFTVAQTHGISMEPHYRSGDIVLLRKAETSSIRAGDVIAYEREDGTIMHRVVEVLGAQSGEPVFITQGDNVSHPDAPVAASQVKAKLVGELPLLGPLSRLFDSEGGFMVYRSLVLGAAMAWVLVWFLFWLQRRSRARPLAAAGFAASPGAPPSDGGEGG